MTTHKLAVRHTFTMYVVTITLKTYVNVTSETRSRVLLNTSVH